MAEKKSKKTTIDDLAIMINDGFNGQMEYMKKEFGRIDERFESVGKDVKSLDTRMNTLEKDVNYIKENLKSAAELEKEVDYIKNTLGIPALKK